ncbi:uncharacterized protein LOC132719115 [Ruditapes philippinarum]|uniref:uncharacterized protein LOC132719115 n=1 Tax=Ruditapes philippinarum TaxID=129788 RepID=UPI00295B6F61|nr:uncharacterized protein LOC132719115 [Ruditapes philippinarum]
MHSFTCFFLGFFSTILVTRAVTRTGVVIDCYNTTVKDYNGHQQTTETGTPCIRWDSNEDYKNEQFRDATISDAANFCRAVGENYLWCLTDSGDWGKCGIEKCDDNGISKCGNLKIEKPALLGRNVTFTFTPDSHDPEAILEWQRAAKGNPWFTRPLTYKFTQYNEEGTYYMVLTDSVLKSDEVYYRIHYYNKTVHCWMKAGKLELDVPPSAPELEGLQDIDTFKKCIVGSDKEEIQVHCKTSGGKPKVNADVTVGEDSFQALQSDINKSVYIAFIKLADRYHNATITCSVKNDALISPLNTSAKVYIIKPPATVKLSAPINLKEGSPVHITCLTQSSRPPPDVYLNISGIEVSSTDVDTRTSFKRDTSLYSTTTTLTTFKREWNGRNIVCCSYNKWYNTPRNCSEAKQVNFTWNQRQMSSNKNETLIGVIVGICLALVVIILVMVIAIRKKRNNDQAQHKRDQPSQERNSLPPQENEHAASGKDVAFADDQCDVTYSQPIKKKKVAAVCDETYAEVDKTRKRNHQAKGSAAEGQRSEDGQLMYVDLEFNEDGKMQKEAVTKRLDSPTEYVGIDFAKTAAYIAEENDTAEMDIIYINQ